MTKTTQLPNQTKRGSAFVCDLKDAGLFVAHNHPTPEQSAVIEEYRRSYANAFGHDPRGVHVVRYPSDADGLAVLFQPLVLSR